MDLPELNKKGPNKMKKIPAFIAGIFLFMFARKILFFYNRQFLFGCTFFI